MEQLKLKRVAVIDRIKDRAVYVAGAFADPDWKREAESAVMVLCRMGNDFTGDDVWRLLHGTLVKTHEPRALGAVFAKLAKEGLISQTGEYRKSTRKERHRCPMAVWRAVRHKHNAKEAQ